MDWLPGDREGQVNMAKVWGQVIPARGVTWGIPAEAMADLANAVTAADTVLKIALSSARTNEITIECQRLFRILVDKMRKMKDRYFKDPPLLDEDFVALLLEPKDTQRTPRGEPKAQITADIGRSGAAMLHLTIRYAEGTKPLADKHTDIGQQIRYGLLPAPGIERKGKDLATVPTEPEDLPHVFETKRKHETIPFDISDSAKTAYFCMRLSNGVGGYGPWCPLFHAVVP